MIYGIIPGFTFHISKTLNFRFSCRNSACGSEASIRPETLGRKCEDKLNDRMVENRGTFLER